MHLPTVLLFSALAMTLGVGSVVASDRDPPEAPGNSRVDSIGGGMIALPFRTPPHRHRMMTVGDDLAVLDDDAGGQPVLVDPVPGRMPALWWLFVTAGTGVLLLACLLWNRALRRAVTEKTAALQAETARRRQAEQRLGDTDTRMQLMAGSGGVGIWEYEIAEDRLTWDARMFTLYGRTPDKVGHRLEDWQHCLHPDDHDRTAAETWAAVTDPAVHDQAPFDTTFRIVRPDGSVRHIKATARVIIGPDGKPDRMIGIDADITERVEAEAALRVALVELENASVAKSNFFAAMSHELRTPLNAIVGFSDLLTTNYAGKLSPSDKHTFAGYIYDASQRLLELIEQIFDYAAAGPGGIALSREPVALGGLLTEAVGSLAGLAAIRDIRIDIAAGDGPVTILGDRDALRKIIHYVVGNAAERSPTGGTVQVTMLRQPDWVDIAVSDSGSPIGEATAIHLLNPVSAVEANPFYTDGVWRLGLAIAKALIEQHGGQLSITNIPGDTAASGPLPTDSGPTETGPTGTGNRLVIRLPRVKPPAAHGPIDRPISCDPLIASADDAAPVSTSTVPAPTVPAPTVPAPAVPAPAVPVRPMADADRGAA